MILTTRFHLIAFALLGLAASAVAESKVTLTGVHNCCKSCTKGIEGAVTSVSGATAAVSEDKVTITAGSDADVQKATDALVAAGYTGASDNSAVKVTPGTAPDKKVTSLTVTGTHMCCDKCVKAAEKAINSVAGVKSDTVTKKTDNFKVEGDFNAKELMAALAKAGFTGKAAN